MHNPWKLILLAGWLGAVGIAQAAGEGRLQLSADHEGAIVYVNGEKKAMLGTGATDLLLPEGDYEIRVEAKSDDGDHIYRTVKQVFIGAKTSTRLDLKLQAIETEQRKTRVAKEKADVEERRGKEKAAKEQLKAKHRARYVANADGTALDKETRLMWMRCAMGQTWNGTTCTGNPSEYTWDKARSLHHSFAGHSDWRLPTIEELRTLVYCSHGRPDYFSSAKNTSEKDSGCEGEKEYSKPTLIQEVFPNTSPGSYGFWSSSPYGGSSSKAWHVNFYYGEAYDGDRNFGSPVRLVRGGQ